ncbi:MAG TPA: 4Fe-4S ferredoxin [Clostridiales bacterium]|nr:4Fe-4S ferredoxin [Clostridiales bacterium]
MAKRLMVKIDEFLCNGCGLCVPSCAEGALQIVDGVARLVKDSYCDGLGACLGECPQGAITLEEREADLFDAHAVEQHLTALGRATAPAAPAGLPAATDRLEQWPVQLRLVGPRAPFLKGQDIVVAADCVPFAAARFHRDLRRGRPLLVSCPKLDDPGELVSRLVDVVREASPRSLTVAHMEVPCCFGLVRLVQEAVARSGKRIPVRTVAVGTGGEIGPEVDEREAVMPAGRCGA